MLILTKYAEIMLLLFTSHLVKTDTSITMQQTSKWQTHLPYLHLENLRVHKFIF